MELLFYCDSKETKLSPFQRQRNMLYLIAQYLTDFGFKQTKIALLNEAHLTGEFKVCDNIDLDTIYLDFCSYFHMKFGKMPKILKRTENDSNEPLNQRAKVIKAKSLEKGKKESNESSCNEFVITNTMSNAVDSNHGVQNCESHSLISKYRKTVDLFEQFVGETRELAYVIERFVPNWNLWELNEI